MIKKIIRFLSNNAISNFLKRIRLKQLGGLSLWNLGKLYVKGIQKGLLSTRAAAISWNFFFGFFPFLLFFFSVLPFLPHFTEIEELFWSKTIPEYFPNKIGNGIEEVFSGISRYQEESGNAVSWWPILLSIYLSSNAVMAFLAGFKNSYHYEKSKRGFVQLRLIAIGLTVFYALMMVLQLIISYYTKYLPLVSEGTLDFGFVGKIQYNLNYLTGFVFYFLSIFVLFFIGYGNKKSVKSLTFSSLITSIGFFATIFLFSIYISNSKLESIYGVIGTIMILMLFIYFNVILILVGFELNAMLHSIKHKMGEQLEKIEPDLKSFE